MVVRFVSLAGKSACRLPACLSLFLLSATLASASTIRGTVIDPDGQRVAAATVRIEHATQPTRTVVTDPHGEFRAEAVPPGDYEIRVLAPGLRADAVAVTVADGADIPLTIRLALSAIDESIVVSAAQVETVLSTVPGSVMVIDATDLRVGQIETAADALRAVPGANVTRSGGRGALTSLLPRGGESDYTLVLVDGVRQNSFGGGYDFSALLVPDIERIEVVRGPQSALFGPDAIGGVVQVISRPGSALRADVLAEGGSFETARANAAAAGRRGAWSWGAGGEHQRSEGLTGATAANGEVVSNDDYAATVASARGGHAGNTIQVKGSARYVRSERGYPGPFGSDPNGTFPGVDRMSRGTTNTADGAVAFTVLPSDRVRVRADATLADLDSDFTSPYGRSIAETRRATGRLLVDAQPASTFSMSAGAEALDEQATSTFIAGASDRLVPVTRRNTGVFAEGRFTTGRLQATGGLRLDDIRRDALEANPSPSVPRPAFAPHSLVALSPRLAIGWFVVPQGSSDHRWTRLRAAAGTGIRPPDAFEIAFTDNPSLEPERNRSVEAGIEQGLLGGALVVDVTAFHNEYDDLIVAVGRSFVDASRFRTDNIANARARGLEVAVSSRWRGGLEIRAFYAWLDTEVLAVDGAPGQAPPPFVPGDPLIRRPRHAGWLLASLARDRWNVFARLGARGQVLDVDPTLGAFGGTIEGPGYAVIDAGAAIRVGGRLEAFGRVGNVFDVTYEEVVGYPALGRHAMVGVRVAAGR